ncbi:structural maintenance of chromosomes protein 3-like [Nicotiana sylvestris]|uniref:structural maintenance of chromosomes protein 3-like n=1 Tax=Nicotiana sylvestris TaxID=4096 RepID=UPI00388CCE05
MKILNILPSSWESKVNAITEAKDLQELTIDELFGNLKTYEMKRKIGSERRESKKEKNPVLKADSNESSEEDSDMTYLTKRFQKMVRRNGGMLKRGSSSKPKNYHLCHKCRKPGHFIKDYPLMKQEFSKYNPEKAAKRNPVPDKNFKRKRSADNVVKQALVAWKDSSSESENETDVGDNSMMAVESEENEYDSTFSLMAQSDDDDEDDDNNEVNFRDVQRNLKSYSYKKLMSLANILIDAYHSLVEDKDALTLELGEAEQTRDDLVVCVVDLKETIFVEHKKTIDNFSKEKEALVKRVTEIEEERDDLLVVVVDLRETLEGLGTESKPRNTGKGKEVASEEHIRLEKELKAGIGFQREKTPYNPHSKYVTVLDNWLCTYYGNNGHFKENCQDRVQSIQKNKVFAENICDKGNKVEFLSKICTVTNLVTGEVVLVAKIYKNIYVTNFASLQSGDLSCLKAIDYDAELWHRRLGHTSFSLLNKLIQKDLSMVCPCQSSKYRKFVMPVLKESM